LQPYSYTPIAGAVENFHLSGTPSTLFAINAFSVPLNYTIYEGMKFQENQGRIDALPTIEDYQQLLIGVIELS